MRIILSFFFVSCTLNETENNTITLNGKTYCSQAGDCGNGYICVNNQCLTPECSSSSDCPLEKYCNDVFQCVSGCTLNSDCLTGDLCIDKRCTNQDCRNAELDCEIGEYCNPNSGMCYEDSFEHCGLCSFSEWESGINGGECIADRVNESSSCNWNDVNQSGTGCPSLETCFPRYIFDSNATEGGVCVSIFKFKRCDPNNEFSCPRGFSCGSNRHNAPEQQSEIYMCMSDCEFLINNGLY